MRTIQRPAAAVAVAVLITALAACSGGGTPPAPSPSSAPVPTSAAAPPRTGITTGSDVFGAACSAFPQGDAPGSLAAMGRLPVAAAIAANPQLSTFGTAFGKVPGFADALDAQKAVTVLVPSNAAFAELQRSIGDAAFTALLSDPKTLDTLLSDHVVGTRYDATGLVAAGTATAFAGGEVTIGGTATAPTVTGAGGAVAAVVCGNVPTANGTVFVLDKVLLPKS